MSGTPTGRPHRVFEEKVTSDRLEDMNSFRAKLKFGPRIRFDSTGNATPVEEKDTEKKIPEYLQNLPFGPRFRFDDKTKEIVAIEETPKNQELSEETNVEMDEVVVVEKKEEKKEEEKKKEDPTYVEHLFNQWLDRAEVTIENAWIDMDQIVESYISLNHNVLNNDLAEIDAVMSFANEKMHNEVQEETEYEKWIEKKVNSTCEVEDKINKLDKMMMVLKKDHPAMHMTKQNLMNSSLTAERLVKMFVKAQNNISTLQIFGICNKNTKTQSMFAKLSTSLHRSNLALHSLYDVAPRVFNSETQLGKFVTEAEKFSLKLATSLRQVLQGPVPETVSRPAMKKNIKSLPWIAEKKKPTSVPGDPAPTKSISGSRILNAAEKKGLTLNKASLSKITVEKTGTSSKKRFKEPRSGKTKSKKISGLKKSQVTKESRSEKAAKKRSIASKKENKDPSRNKMAVEKMNTSTKTNKKVSDAHTAGDSSKKRTIKESRSAKALKKKSMAKANKDASITKTAELKDTSSKKADKTASDSKGAVNVAPKKAPKKPVALLSDSEDSGEIFPEAELIEHYNIQKKKDTPETDVATAVSKSSKTAVTTAKSIKSKSTNSTKDKVKQDKVKSDVDIAKSKSSKSLKSKTDVATTKSTKSQASSSKKEDKPESGVATAKSMSTKSMSTKSDVTTAKSVSSETTSKLISAKSLFGKRK